MVRVTGFGDAAVTITGALLLLVCFMASSHLAALQWLKAVAACGLLTAIGKLALYMHGLPIPTDVLASPSGHVAASVLVYGVLPLASEQPQQRTPWIALAVTAIGLIATSRIYLHAHTGLDVVAGACIGGACLAWFITSGACRQAPGAVRHAVPLALLASFAGAGFGWRLHLDVALHHAAAGMASYFTPYGIANTLN